MNRALLPNYRRIARVVQRMVFRIILALPLLTACHQDAQPLLLSGTTMGTSYSVKILGAWGREDAGWGRGAEGRGGEEAPAESTLHLKIEAELQRLNQVFSTYEADSELSRLNRHPVNQPAAVSADLMAVLRLSAAVHRLSQGAFDITLAPLVNLWGFGPEGIRDELPAAEDIQRLLLHHTGFDAIALGVGTVTRRKPVTLDLSAVAKGYAVDSIASLLEAAGIRHYLVEIGGEVKARGLNAHGEAWVIGIEKPLVASREVFRTLPLHNVALATSGDYRNFFEVDGVRYSHTLDPTTGWPVKNGLVSVTVLHQSAAWADALATAITVLGVEQALPLAAANGWMFLALAPAAARNKAPAAARNKKLRREEPGREPIEVFYSDAMRAYLEGGVGSN